MTITYIILTILITLFLNASLSLAMPFMKIKWNTLYQRIKPRKHIHTTQPKQIEKLVIDIMKDKINSGLLTYHKKKMVREFVREEVVNYLNEIKK